MAEVIFEYQAGTSWASVQGGWQSHNFGHIMETGETTKSVQKWEWLKKRYWRGAQTTF